MKHFRRFLVFLGLLAFSAHLAAQQITTYFHVDNVGSPIAATDANGNTVWTEEYAPFGERWNVDVDGLPNRQWFTGHTEDKETGLINAGARYYDSAIGRFLSVDPMGVTPQDPSTFNLYAYAKYNPYRYTDPLGLESVSEWIDIYAQSAASRGDHTATFGWAFLGTTWNYFGMEAVSQVADDGWAGSSTSDKIEATYDVASTLLGLKALSAVGKAAKATETVIELRRPYIRKSTREAVEARAPRDASGRPLDPNTGRSIEGKPDLGHKRGSEFRRAKAKAEAEGLTQKEFNDRMNNPDMYQLEDPSTNRSRVFEQKP